METKEIQTDLFDEKQSLQVIREMIEVSQKRFKNNGILFLLWGWLMVLNYLSSYLLKKIILTHEVRMIIKYVVWIVSISAIIFSIYYVFFRRVRVKTYISISLRYVWISLVVCLSLTNMIIFNVIHQFNPALQHPIFMLLISFAIVVSGGIIRYRLLVLGGIFFGILAYACSWLDLQTQILVEAGAWFIAFVIPGHILYAKRHR
jgi:hypothetical protein